MDLTTIQDLIYLPYVRFFIILIGFFLISKLVVFISEKVLLQFTKKTKTNIDDLIVERINKPISFLLMFIGARLAVLSLNITNNIHIIATRIIDSFIIFIGIYIIIAIIDIVIDVWGKSFAAKTKSTLDDNLLNLAHKFLKVAFFIIVFLMILSKWGIQIGPLLASLGIAGIAVAFALQSTLANIFGGISMILDKSVNVGDVVEIDPQTKGTIMDIGLRSTKIKTFNNEMIIIPNDKLANSMINNYEPPDPAGRVALQFGVAYGSKIDKVKKVVLKEINKIEGILIDEEHSIAVRFTEMADSALLFKVYFWMQHYGERFRAIDEANTLIYNALNKNKISIPFPQMDIWIKQHKKR